MDKRETYQPFDISERYIKLLTERDEQRAELDRREKDLADSQRNTPDYKKPD